MRKYCESPNHISGQSGVYQSQRVDPVSNFLSQKWNETCDWTRENWGIDLNAVGKVVGSGAMIVADVAILAAATGATGGWALLGAGVGVTSLLHNASDFYEATQEVYVGKGGQEVNGFNPLRDVVFKDNEGAYYAVEGIADTGTLVLAPYVGAARTAEQMTGSLANIARANETTAAAEGAKKVDINNPVLDNIRSGSALKEDSLHAFNNIIDNYASDATKFSLVGGDGVKRSLYQIEGSLNGKSGIFEWIVDPDPTKGVTHRRFIEGAGITGKPNARP